MLAYAIRRILYAIPTVIGVLLLTYFLFFGVSSPEVIARRNLSSRNPTQEQIQGWLRDHGYGEPSEEQMKADSFGQFLLNMGIKPKEKTDVENFNPSLAARLMQLKRSTLDVMLFQFGKSDTSQEEIWSRITKGAGPSFIIQSIIFGTALFVSLAFAIAVAYFRGTYVDNFGTFLCVLLMSVVYIVYIIGMQFLLGKVLQYGPVWGFDTEAGIAKFIRIPVIIGVLAGLGARVRLYRTFLLDEINQDYVRTARAKGVSERNVLLKHVLKNAMIPLITNTVAVIPTLILGGLLIENFFGIPGLGSYLVDAINAQDFAVVRAMVFLGTLLYIVGLILTDICYALVDPRVRLG
jgi:peptide/nickel transport system permease protein